METLFTNEERESLRGGVKLRHNLWKFVYKTKTVFVLKYRADGGIHYAAYVDAWSTNINFNLLEIAAQHGMEFVDGHTTGWNRVHEEMESEVLSWSHIKSPQI